MRINKISGWLNRCAAAFCLVLSTSAIAGLDITTYFHNDVSGTPMLATGSNGQVVWKETYRPYGQKLLTNAAASGSEVGFSGKPFDHNTGLSYMGARYYDPALGRFTGIDPKEVDPNDLHTFNRYAYANNNPYKYVDPDGRSPLDVAFLMYDLGKLGLAMYSGVGVGAAVADVALSAIGVASPVPGVGQAMKAARTAERAIEVGKGAEKAVEVSNVAKGGTYVLKDVEGSVVRTGRTKDLARREAEHGRNHPDKTFEVDKRTDNLAAQRGREQDLHDANPSAHAVNGGLDKVNGISPNNPRRGEYLRAGRELP